MSSVSPYNHNLLSESVKVREGWVSADDQYTGKGGSLFIKKFVFIYHNAITELFAIIKDIHITGEPAANLKFPLI